MNRSRLEKLEAAAGVRAADRGAYCWDCGGFTIDDAMRARNALSRGSWHGMTAAAAAEFFAVIAAAPDICRRCGGPTLEGVARRELAVFRRGV